MSTFRLGVDYYPEQWPEERWETDARLMEEAGFNVVRLAEFGWARLEPLQGHFDFDWLDRAIAVLHGRGLQIVLGTPTASPPPWLMAGDPSLYRVGADGRAATYGHRRGYCPHHPAYWEHSCRIVAAMAERYAGHPAVIGWQIDNEFGDRSYSPAAQRAFQGWLTRKYGALEELNSAWGTTFWGHIYRDWAEIPVPLESGGPHNPGLALDFARFHSDGIVAYQRMQIGTIRAHDTAHFITHNFMGFGYDSLDYFDLARDLDFVSWDNYPRMWWNLGEGNNPGRAALAHATMRGLKGENFWVMEQQGGAGGWEMVVPHPRPGELRLWAYQAVAHGADGIVFFRLRAARHGAEQYWHGLLDHDATPGRRYQEACSMGKELRRLGPRLVGSRVTSRVALILDYDSRFALQVQQNHPELFYTAQVQTWHDALHRRNLSTDIVPAGADLSSYTLVVAPLLHVVTPETARNLRRFVEGGGSLVITPRSGVKDGANAVVDEALPGLLRGLAGARVEEYDALYGCTNGLESHLAGLEAGTARLWCDILEPEGAEVLATYTAGYYAGRAGLTRHRVGRGQVIYLGTFGEEAPEGLLAWLITELGLKAPLAAPDGVEVTERHGQGERFVFLLNHTAEDRRVAVAANLEPLLGGEVIQGRLSLRPYGVEVLCSRLSRAGNGQEAG